MGKTKNKNRKLEIKELTEKLERYEKKLAERRLGYGEVVRTRFGDSYSDQLRDDTNALEAIIHSIKEEVDMLKKKK